MILVGWVFCLCMVLFFFPKCLVFIWFQKPMICGFAHRRFFVQQSCISWSWKPANFLAKIISSAFVFMSDYGIWVNFTRFNISWKAGVLKNAEPVKLVLFLKIWFRALANAHRSGSPAQDVTWVPWAASAPCGAGKARHDVVLRTWRCTLLSDTKTWIYTCHPLKGLALWLNGNIEKSRVSCKP